MGYRIGIDIGGTFTDFALFDESTNRLSVYKELTTPDDPADAVLRGLSTLLDRDDVAIDEVGIIDHGTTLVTNAVIERKGAPTGMLVTAGLEDVLDIGEERRYDLFDLRLRFPDPVVPRRMRRPVTERMHYSGSPQIPVDIDGMLQAVSELVEKHGIRSLAVCLLHSYANTEHENLITELVEQNFPDLYVTSSSDVLPYMREYHRWTTTAINAYVRPTIDVYLHRLEKELVALGFSGHFNMMTSSGGTVTLDTARRYPVRLLESGPAAGALMSAFHGRALGLPNLLSFDMGGTTAKGALIGAGVPLKKYGMEVAREHQYKAGSGFQVSIPTIDLIEIGAGGGSIAEVDQRGLIRVGPRSAGASPGPACYGQGGDQPTLTDANLVLGYLDPSYFLGGRMKLNLCAARQSIENVIGRPLDLGLIRAAWGIHEMINEDVARAFRVHASERGFDYRDCSMVAFGGSGPMHAVRIAKKLGVPRVILPPAAGVMSAHGLLVSPLSFETVRSYRVELLELDGEMMEETFAPLLEMVTGFLKEAGAKSGDIDVKRKLDMRYVGQGHEVEVVLPNDGSFDQIPGEFERAYKRLFSSIPLKDPLEIVNWKVEANVPRVSDNTRFSHAGFGNTKKPNGKTRLAYFPEPDTNIECPVYSRYSLESGVSFQGPALIEEQESTCVVGLNDTFEIDQDGNVIIRISQEAEQ